MTEHPTDAELALHIDEDELPGSPDQLPAAMRRRAATLVTAGWRLYTAGPADAELRVRATRGWADVAAWLDEIGAAQDADIVPLRR